MNRLRVMGLVLALVTGVAVSASAQSALGSIPVGANTHGVAVNAATNKVYAIGGLGNFLVEIDGLTGARTTIPLQATSGAAHAEVVVNPRTNTIYVVNVVSNNVAVVAGATRAVSFIPLGTTTYSIALNATTNRIYVTHFDAAMVSVIDGATNVVTTVPVGLQPSAIAVNQKTNRIYVTNTLSNSASIINGADNSVSTVPVGAYPMELTIDEKSNRAFVVNLLADSVTVINGTVVVATIGLPAGSRPDLARYNPVQKRLYVTFQFPGTLAVINPANAAVQMIGIGGAFVNDMVVDTWRNTIYLADPAANQLVALDAKTFAKTTVANPGTHLWHLALNPLTNVVYGASLASNSVSVFAGVPVAIPWNVFKSLKL